MTSQPALPEPTYYKNSCRPVKSTLKQHSIKNRSGVRLCLHQSEAADACIGTVILAHGMFSNYRTCRGLASYLTTQHYDCWLLDYQGHGLSDHPDHAPDFESMCLEDTESTLDFIQSSSDKPIWWLGHSGGGLAILMFLARNPDRQEKLAGIITLASQATDAGLSWQHRLVFRVSRILLKFTKTVPGKPLGLGPEKEYSSVLDQWLLWSIAKHWSGTDDFDYLAHMADIKIPTLMISGVGDRFIAPTSGCKRLHDNLASTDKTFLLLGKDNGFLEDYTHDRLISSRNASTDVWPLIGQWLLQKY